MAEKDTTPAVATAATGSVAAADTGAPTDLVEVVRKDGKGGVGTMTRQAYDDHWADNELYALSAASKKGGRS